MAPQRHSGQATVSTLAESWLHLHLIHGQGVVRDGRSGELLFVDIPVGRIWRFDAQSKGAHLDVPGMVGAVHPTVDPRVVVFADSNSIAVNGPDGVRLAAPLSNQSDLRMNDANVDPAGRYLAGGMAVEQRAGAPPSPARQRRQAGSGREGRHHQQRHRLACRHHPLQVPAVIE